MAGGVRLQAARQLSTSPALIPALLTVGAFVVLAISGGGYDAGAWMPVALLALALLAVAALTFPTEMSAPRLALVALGLLVAYTVWSGLSIIWADSPGVALEGTSRTLMYTVSFALFALWPMRPNAAAVVIGAFGLAIAGLGLFVLLRADPATQLASLFQAGRFYDPVDYTNANVALWFLGFIPCVFLAARGEVPPVARGLGLGGATLLADLALLGQSRGWLFTLPVVLALFLAVAPGRARNAVTLLVIAGAVVATLDPVLGVLEGIQNGEPAGPLLDDARRAILPAAAILGVIGTTVGYLERSVRVGATTERRAAAATMASLSVVAVATVAVLLIVFGDPVARASDAWEEFTSGTESGDEIASGAETSRFGELGSNRYDYWRVAWARFRDEPLLGIGADNFQQDYLELRRSPERGRYPHSVELRALAQTGVVGFLLLGGAIGVALFAGVGATRRGPPLQRAAAGAVTATFLYWLVHGSVDWFWEMPALGAPAFAMLGLAASFRHDVPASPGPASRGPLVRGRLGVAAVAVAALLLAAPLALQLVADWEVDRAVAVWPTDPGEAFTRLERAADLNPLSSVPDQVAGAIALRLDDPQAAEDHYLAAIARDPRSSLAALQLGATASELGRREDAAEWLKVARERDPLDEISRDALRDVRAGRVLDANAIYDMLLERRSALVGE